MSILDTIKDKMTGGSHEGQVMRMVSQLVTDCGGFDGLVGKFNAVGLSATVKSWLSSGTPQSISPEQIQKALGSSQIQSLATKFGFDTNQVASNLATHLPKMIGQFSSGGSVPKEGGLKH